MYPAFAFTASLALAYLIGAVPFAYLVTKRFKAVDIRLVGSRNAGALNVFRSIGKGYGLVVFLLDAAKGLLAIYITRWIDAPEITAYLAAIFVALGHNWSIFMRLSGGKGVAVVFGVSLAVLPWLTLIVLAPTLAAFAISRQAVLSFAGGFILLNILTIITSQSGGQIALCLLLTLLVAGTHFGRAAPEYLSLARQRKWSELSLLE